MIWWGGQLPDLERLTEMGTRGLGAHLGIVFDAVGDDWLRGKMPVGPPVHQPFGRLHGGASIALAETVGSMAAAMVVDPDCFASVGMEINANHVRPAFDGWVYGTGKAESLGRTTQIWSIRIEDQAGRLICLSRLTIAVIALERR